MGLVVIQNRGETSAATRHPHSLLLRRRTRRKSKLLEDAITSVDAGRDQTRGDGGGGEDRRDMKGVALREAGHLPICRRFIRMFAYFLPLVRHFRSKGKNHSQVARSLSLMSLQQETGGGGGSTRSE